MDALSVVIWLISLYFAFRFGKGFGKSLTQYKYRWTCAVPDCTFRVSCNDADQLLIWSLAHMNASHKPEVQDGVAPSSEEGSR